MTNPAGGPLRLISVADLDLDDENPRLPETVLESKKQSDVLEYLYEHGELEELAYSFLDNGYFEYEPLFVTKSSKSRYRVIEGNRRAATLIILLQLRPAQDADIEFQLDRDPTADQLGRLSKAPCYVVSHRDDLRTYLGFRHIGGLRMWNPEAKARYLYREVERLQPLAKKQNKNVFTLLGREVGSNAQGVRNPYIAIRILLHARSEYGLDVSYVQRRRFGVWVRCMNSPELRTYIGFDGAKSYEQIEDSLGSLKKKYLSEVLGDLAPSKRRKRAVLADSRDVTDYARVLAHPEARKALRQYEDLDVAKQVVERDALPSRIQHLADSVSVILDQIEREGAFNELLAPSEELFGLARSLRAVIRASLDEEDDE